MNSRGISRKGLIYVNRRGLKIAFFKTRFSIAILRLLSGLPSIFFQILRFCPKVPNFARVWHLRGLEWKNEKTHKSRESDPWKRWKFSFFAPQARESVPFKIWAKKSKSKIWRKENGGRWPPIGGPIEGGLKRPPKGANGGISYARSSARLPVGPLGATHFLLFLYKHHQDFEPQSLWSAKNLGIFIQKRVFFLGIFIQKMRFLYRP